MEKIVSKFYFIQMMNHPLKINIKSRNERLTSILQNYYLYDIDENENQLNNDDSQISEIIQKI